jgi:hypothetical protein
MGKSVLVASIVALLFPLAACGQTEVTSNILDSITWTTGGSPYLLSGTIRVRNNSTLSIDPGVEVRFKTQLPGSQLETDAGSSIVAVGTAGDSIVFTSDSATPAAGDWGAVMVFASTGSRFAHCAFRHGYQALYYSTCGNLSGTDVDRCTFENCVIGMSIVSSSPTVYRTWFLYASTNVLCRNSDSEPTFRYCNFLPSRYGENITLQYYPSAAQIDATFCWWGSDQPGDIADSIHDGNDDHGLHGYVLYEPYLTETPVTRSSWGAIKALFR